MEASCKLFHVITSAHLLTCLSRCKQECVGCVPGVSTGSVGPKDSSAEQRMQLEPLSLGLEESLLCPSSQL